MEQRKQTITEMKQQVRDLNAKINAAYRKAFVPGRKLQAVIAYDKPMATVEVVGYKARKVVLRHGEVTYAEYPEALAAWNNL